MIASERKGATAVSAHRGTYLGSVVLVDRLGGMSTAAAVVP